MEEYRYLFFQNLVNSYPGGIDFLRGTSDGRIVLKPKKGKISFIYVRTSGFLKDDRGTDGFSLSCLVKAGQKNSRELFELMLSACKLTHSEQKWRFEEHEAVVNLVAEALIKGLKPRALHAVLNMDFNLLKEIARYFTVYKHSLELLPVPEEIAMKLPFNVTPMGLSFEAERICLSFAGGRVYWSILFTRVFPLGAPGVKEFNRFLGFELPSTLKVIERVSRHL